MSDQGQGHYSTVVRSMAEGRVVPLLGAGVNLASRPRGKAWKQGQYLPNGYELAKYLAGIFYFPEAAYDRSGIELFEREIIPALS